MNLEKEAGRSFDPAIRRAKLDNLTIYEISEQELSTLEHGSPNATFLNIAIALLSAAISLLSALLLSDTESIVITVVFVVIVVVGFIVGGVLLILWLRIRSSVSICIEKIRKRLPPEGASADLQEDTPNNSFNSDDKSGAG